MTSRLVQPFYRAHGCDQHTDTQTDKHTHRQTDHAMYRHLYQQPTSTLDLV